MDYFMLIGAAMLLGGNFALNKIYQRIYGSEPKEVFFLTSTVSLITTIVFFFVGGCSFEVSFFSCLMAALMAIFGMSYSVIGFRLLKSGTIATYTLSLMTGGMLLPYLYGLLFLNESATLLRIFALIFIVAGVVLSNFDKEKLSLKQLGMCVSVFVLNGCVSIVSKIHQSQTAYESVNTSQFVALCGLFQFLIAGALFLFLKRKQGRNSETVEVRDPVAEAETKVGWGKAVAIAAASAVIGGVSSLLQLLGAKSLPATVLYPFISGGSIVFSALAGLIFFKEKLSVRMIGSIILCVIGTVMFL